MLELENLTLAEKEAITELKRRTENDLSPTLLKDPTLYYRFLKARDFNVKHAEILLRKHLSDRKIYGIEGILTDYKAPEHIQTYYPISFMGFDKEGHIVVYIDTGASDHKGIVAAWPYRELVRYNTYYLEHIFARLVENNKKTGKAVSKMIVIMNMNKINLFQATFKKGIESMINGFKLYQDNYPERVKSIYIINASFYFNIGFSIIKTCLAGGLLQKIQIYGREGWKDDLLDIIDADVLPAFLGGDRTDPDGNPMCNTFLVHGKPIPEELQRKSNNKTLSREIGVKKLTVTRFSCSEIVFYVYEQNSLLEWEFETKSRDIGFVLYYKDNRQENAELEELIPKQRMDTLLGSETGVYKCDKTGTYIIVFDNSYSWIYSKEIYYIIRLIRPNEIKALTN